MRLLNIASSRIIAFMLAHIIGEYLIKAAKCLHGAEYYQHFTTAPLFSSMQARLSVSPTMMMPWTSSERGADGMAQEAPDLGAAMAMQKSRSN